MSNYSPSLLDTVLRIYKNSEDRVIGIHTITINIYKQANPVIPGTIQTPQQMLAREVKEHSQFQRFNLSMGEPRTISSVLMMGKYDDFTMNGSDDDISSIKYNKNDDLQNDIIVSLTEYPTIGDEV